MREIEAGVATMWNILEAWTAGILSNVDVSGREEMIRRGSHPNESRAGRAAGPTRVHWQKGGAKRAGRAAGPYKIGRAGHRSGDY